MLDLLLLSKFDPGGHAEKLSATTLRRGSQVARSGAISYDLTPYSLQSNLSQTARGEVLSLIRTGEGRPIRNSFEALAMLELKEMNWHRDFQEYTGLGLFDMRMTVQAARAWCTIPHAKNDGSLCFIRTFNVCLEEQACHIGRLHAAGGGGTSTMGHQFGNAFLRWFRILPADL